MIVLDTNVLSEPLRVRPDVRVIDWLGANHDVGTTAVTVGELLTGARMLPIGKRREGLLAAIDEMLGRYRDNVAPYDSRAANVYAELQETRRAEGTPLSVEDGMIAAICVSRGTPLATRNIKDFEGLGLELINPWRA